MAKKARVYGQFPGVSGLVEEPKFQGWVEIEGVRVTNPIDTEETAWGELQLTLRVGRPATQLAAFELQGQTMQRVRVAFLPAEDAKAPRMMSEMNLADVLIASTEFRATKCQVVLSYGKIGYVRRPAPVTS